MADTISKKKRSALMASIKSTKNKSTEIRVVRILRGASIKGWRRHPALPGRPDIVWRKQKIALFVDGCFWHGCDKCYRRPKTNRKYWDGKIRINQLRDKKVNQQLRKMGWKVFRLRECQIKSNSYMNKKLKRIKEELASRKFEV